MRTRLLSVLVLAPWLFFVVCQPLAGLTIDDQTGNVTSCTGLWWVTGTLLFDDPKGTLPFALCPEQPGDVGLEVVGGVGFGCLAAQLNALTKVVKIHELVRVYLI